MGLVVGKIHPNTTVADDGFVGIRGRPPHKTLQPGHRDWFYQQDRIPQKYIVVGKLAGNHIFLVVKKSPLYISSSTTQFIRLQVVFRMSYMKIISRFDCQALPSTRYRVTTENAPITTCKAHSPHAESAKASIQKNTSESDTLNCKIILNQLSLSH